MRKLKNFIFIQDFFFIFIHHPQKKQPWDECNECLFDYTNSPHTLRLCTIFMPNLANDMFISFDDDENLIEVEFFFHSICGFLLNVKIKMRN